MKNVVNNLGNFLNHFKRNSITLRLTLLYALSTFAALLASSVFLYHVLVNDLFLSDEKVVDNEIRLVKNVLVQHRGKIVMLDPQSNERKAYYLRVLNTKGEILLETPDMSLQFDRKDFASPPSNGENSHIKTVKSIDNRYYMTRSGSVIIPGHKPYELIIQMALDTNHHQTVKAKYQIRLAIIILVGIFLSGILGAFVAFKGMKPVRRVTDKLLSYKVTQLNERIDASNCPAELMTMVNAFNLLLAKIERSFNQLTQFSADIAHELRTPLHHLMVETDICLRKERNTKEYQETLQSSLEEYNKLGQLIDRLLFLARAENPETAINRAKISIEKEFQALHEFYQLACEEKNIQLRVVGSGFIEAEPILFRRAINNLLTNAIKHTKEYGKVNLIATEDENYYIIKVIDTGIGIDPSHLPHLFDRFYRVDYSRSKQAGGHGLGLAIVKSIMELHHGMVDVTSQPEIGTTFRLYFPKDFSINK
ncbi:MAG: hypothetical protein CMF49_06620 [Legionellales bacterium]|nr:hypothetical protein [Legionellales bacterium]